MTVIVGYSRLSIATINLAIDADADDDDDNGSNLNATGDATEISAGHADLVGGALTAGFRFTNVNVPQGSVVSVATLTVEVITVQGSPDLNVFGVDVDDAAGWSGGNLPSDTTQTTASTNATPGATGSLQIDVTDQVQEIVNRGGWSSGNALALTIFDNSGSGTNIIIIEAREAGNGNEATLDITFG